MYDRNEKDHVMPFSDLSNFDLIIENEPVRTVILDRLDNNGFHTFLRHCRRETGMETDSHETGNQYYDYDFQKSPNYKYDAYKHKACSWE